MPNAAAELIQAGGLTVRFHVDADEPGGSVSVFECDVPAKARMPAPQSHDDFDKRCSRSTASRPSRSEGSAPT